MDATEGVEEYDEHKEKLWDLIVKHRRDKAFIRKVTRTSRAVKNRGKQTTINSFFKLTSLNTRNDRDKYGNVSNVVCCDSLKIYLGL